METGATLFGARIRNLFHCTWAVVHYCWLSCTCVSCHWSWRTSHPCKYTWYCKLQGKPQEQSSSCRVSSALFFFRDTNSSHVVVVFFLPILILKVSSVLVHGDAYDGDAEGELTICTLCSYIHGLTSYRFILMHMKHSNSFLNKYAMSSYDNDIIDSNLETIYDVFLYVIIIIELH